MATISAERGIPSSAASAEITPVADVSQDQIPTRIGLDQHSTLALHDEVDVGTLVLVAENPFLGLGPPPSALGVEPSQRVLRQRPKKRDSRKRLGFSYHVTTRYV